MCDLTGLEVGNASLYDGGSACVEAALMAVRLQKKRHTILISAGLHPLYQECLCTNITPHEGLKLVQVGLKDGVTDLADLAAKLDGDVAAVLVGYPNFLGCVEDLKAIGDAAPGGRGAGGVGHPGGPGLRLAGGPGQGPAPTWPAARPCRSATSSTTAARTWAS